ncbi:MAG: hypothetical protein WDA06_01375 [Phenylobacterium sp.]
MNWFVFAQSKNTEQICRFIKKQIRQDPFFIRLFKLFNIPIDRIDNLTIKIKPLYGMSAKSNSKTIILDKEVIDKSDTLNDIMHFIVHEICHWLIRQREKEQYFSDPEEHFSFIHAIAYEMKRGQSLDVIKDTFLPMIKAHFTDTKCAEVFYDKLVRKASEINAIFEDNNELV